VQVLVIVVSSIALCAIPVYSKDEKYVTKATGGNSRLEASPFHNLELTRATFLHRAGHDLFSQEKPEAVQASQERLQKEFRKRNQQ
jgi:hypothetical protein